MRYDIKNVTTILYLKTYSETYQYSELKILLGLNTSQLKEFIDKLISEGFIEDRKKLLLTQKSLNYLKVLGLDNVEFNSLMENKVSIKFTEKKLTFNDIYIPKEFKL